ncbi:MAG: hypothetical protein P8L77_04085, partial [Gammaproteobacteria bacterium]|nr:hypothetical protein [Gammaproteobacteria bacterium]
NQVADNAYYTHDLVGAHKSFVDPKNVDQKPEDVTDKGPIAHNVSVFNGAVANTAGQACTSFATKLGFGDEG